MPPAKKIAAADPAPAVVAQAAKLAAAKPSAAQNKHLALARAFIKDKTGHKQVEVFKGQRPFVPSGCFAIDDLIGGSLCTDGSDLPKCPGFPRRAISEVFGEESSGKTTAVLSAIAECQAQGGVAMFLDYEHALDQAYAEALGVSFDPDKLLLYAPNTYEEGVKMIFAALKGGVDLIAVDSVAAMLPAAALEKSLDKVATLGSLAKAMAETLPKITVWLNSPQHSSNPKGTAIVFINQTRAEINSQSRGASTHTSGGKALKFYCFLRLSYTRIGSEYVERKDKITGAKKRYPYGNHTIVKVIKNKVDGKQGHATNIFIRYGLGIDEHYTLISAAVANKLIKKTGAWFVLGEERFQGREQLRNYLKSNAKAFDDLRKKVLNIIQTSAKEAAEELDEDDVLMEAFAEGFDDDDSPAKEDSILDEEDDDGGVVGDAVD